MKQLAEQHGNEQLIVVFGLNEPNNLRTIATTFKDGDPSYAGALAGISLGLKSYHIFELKGEIPADIWSEQMAMEELEIEDDTKQAILQTMQQIRGD